MAEVKRINLALQGGGAHGAFTWGVLDRFLSDDGIEIAGISGTSAGALNGAALKAGLLSGGRRGARENLAWLWGQIGAINDMRLTSWMSAFGPGPGLMSRMLENSLPYSMADTASRMMSPYALGPFYRNPLERITRRFQFDKVCAKDGPAFFVSATNVRSGKIRVFSGNEITAEVLMASACLPEMFQAVEIDDPETGRREAYWDGGYTGNPALFPLFEPALPDDVVVVNINPLYRDSIPQTPQEIQNRINEISFNSSLMRELRAISFVRRLIAEGRVERGTMTDVLIHMVADDALMGKLGVATKLLPSPLVLNQLKEAGYGAADRFLAAHREALNVTATVDLEEMFG